MPSSRPIAAVGPPSLLVITGASLALVRFTVRVCTSVRLSAPSSVTVTSTTYLLSPSESAGVSKSGATLKLRTPKPALISKRSLSGPPVRVNTRLSLSGSSAIKVVTSVVFSAISTEAVSPPPLLVMMGASCLSVTVMPKSLAVVSLLSPSSVRVISTS